MKLEVGKYYKTRDGRKVGPMSIDGDDELGFVWMSPDDDDGRYDADGNDGEMPYGEHPSDLIAEWQDEPPTIGTLAEIGAKVGDVVEWVSDDGDVTDYDITLMTEDHGPFPDHAQLDDFMLAPIDQREYQFRIVTRATKGPVITETITKIVPGIYGKAEVTDIGNVWMQPVINREDLTAAIETPTIIRDAMAQNERT